MEKKLKIGIIVSETMVEYDRNIIRGVENAAEGKNVNIVVIPARYIGRELTMDEDPLYEYQYTTLLDMVKDINLDGVIVEVGSVCSHVGERRREAFMKMFDEIPHVFISVNSKNNCCVNFDNKSGLLEGLEFIYSQGCRKFCMVGGAEKSKDAIERREGFISFLQSKGLEFNESMYISGNFVRECNEQVNTLLNRNRDADAVIAANDDMAEAVYEELKKRDKMPGEDISVLGYDDKYTAARMYPSLSTVRADSIKLGKVAMQLLLRNIDENCIEEVVLPTKLIKRNSVVVNSEDDKFSFENSINEEVKLCFHEENLESTLEINARIDKLIGYLHVNPDEMDLTKLSKTILSIVDDILENCTVENADIDKMITVLDRFYREETGSAKSFSMFKYKQNMYMSIYRKIMYAVNGYYADVYQSDYDRNSNLRNFARSVLNFEHGSDYSYGKMLDALRFLGVKNAYIFTLENSKFHLFGDSFTFPEKMFLKATMKEGTVKVIPGVSQKIVLGKILDNYYLNWNGYRSLVMLPLFSTESFYGIILCDFNANSLMNAEMIVDQMSSAVKMKTLLQENEVIQHQLEENLNLVKESNIELDNLSKSDALTGLNNRRGFFANAELFREEATARKKSVAVVYVDMNNLKIINDKYGHEEGDFSLETIGRLIKEFVGEKGISGRIGGDEFAFIMEYDSRESRSLIKKIYNIFENFNRNSDKDYLVTVAAGAHCMRPGDSTTLTEALAFADEKLYEEKRLRSKDVAKTKKSKTE